MRLWIAAAMLALGLLTASAANAGGGAAIANAPELPIGTLTSSGVPSEYNFNLCCHFWTHPNTPGVEYWRLLLAAGDKLVIDYTDTAPEPDGNSNVSLCLLPPATTDFTVANVNCVATDETTTQHEFSFNSPTAGDWVLAVGDNGCCDTGAWGYSLTAYVHHATHTTISAPRLVRAHGKVSYSGTVSGAQGGQVQLQSRSTAHPVWKTFALATIGPNGSFKFATKVAEPGTYRIKAVYPGDNSHQPSTGMVTFKVV